MTFEEFSQQVTAMNLTPRDCGDGHWQIRGGKFLVNFYPDARKGPSFFVNGMHSGRRYYYDVRQAFRDAIIATEQPPPLKSHMLKAKRWGFSKRDRKKRNWLRRSLYAKSKKCYWCRKDLLLHEATLDHMIPISKGGSNGPDNQVLACEGCNHGRKNDLPTKTEWQHV